MKPSSICAPGAWGWKPLGVCSSMPSPVRSSSASDFVRCAMSRTRWFGIASSRTSAWPSPGSMFDDLTELYQQVILDHSKRPRNFRKIDGANRTAEGHNPLCGDHVTMFMSVDGDAIRDISFLGDGCAIYKASASLLTESLKGKSQA